MVDGRRTMVGVDDLERQVADMFASMATPDGQRALAHLRSVPSIQAQARSALAALTEALKLLDEEDVD